MATETDWSRANEGGDQMNATTRNLFPTNDRDDPAHHGHKSSPFDVLTSSGFLKTVGLAAIATTVGIAIGFWVGGRREAKRHRSALTTYDMGDVAKLVPLATHLIANPVVRAYGTRLLVRQLRKYLDS